MPTTEIYTLSLHDALPISNSNRQDERPARSTVGKLRELAAAHNTVSSFPVVARVNASMVDHWRDRKSTRLNSSHVKISYAVFCLKKKNVTIKKIISMCR